MRKFCSPRGIATIQPLLDSLVKGELITSPRAAFLIGKPVHSCREILRHMLDCDMLRVVFDSSGKNRTYEAGHNIGKYYKGQL